MDIEMNNMRMNMDLTGSWTMIVENTGTDFDKQSIHGWREVTIPCTYEHCLPELIGFQGTCLFEKHFFVPAAMRSRRIILNFQAVNYHATIWVNGKYAGSNDEGFLPFDIPISEFCQFGEENIVRVRTNNETSPGELPPVHFWRSQGGIIRNISLIATEWIYIQDIKILAEPNDGNGHLKVIVVLKNELSKAEQVEISIKTVKTRIRESSIFLHESVVIDPGVSTEVVMETCMYNVDSWSPDTPVLYSANIEISINDVAVDNQTVRFGFRTICVQEGKVLLNGVPVFFNGFNRHEDYPDTRLAINRLNSRRDFEEIKKSGANFVRMCHYPHDIAELEWCDELGLLVMDEIPLCALLFDGPGTSMEDSRHALGLTLDHAKAQLRRLIARDYNHPSVIFWSVSNETNEKEDGVIDINNTLVQLAKKLDPSRLAMHVSMEPYWTSDLMDKMYQYDDVICINEYSPLYQRLNLHNKRYGSSDAEMYWMQHSKKFTDVYPGKPVFVTEFGYQTGHWMDGIKDDEMQAYMIVTDYTAMHPYVCGSLVWCFADHAWPLLWPSRLPVYGRDISLYGVMTRDRKEKLAFEVYKKMISD